MKDQLVLTKLQYTNEILQRQHGSGFLVLVVQEANGWKNSEQDNLKMSLDLMILYLIITLNLLVQYKMI